MRSLNDETKKLSSDNGFSIIELLIVLTLLAVLTTIAIVQFSDSKTDFERQRIAREFKVYIERARFDSVKRRAAEISDMSRITMNSSSSFTVALDLNGNGKLDTAETRIIDFTERSNTQIIVSSTLNYPVTILFNQRGHVIARDNLGNDIDPVFTICSKNCLATSQDEEDLTVLSISKTGTVAVLKGGQSPSALPTPAITNTSPLLNCHILLANVNTASCVSN
jgi:prepilin-type N-terminal cleavage/methylation domain-containing protein